MEHNNIVGQVIKKVRQLTKAEQKRESWYNTTYALVLSNGVVLYPSQDEEGNDAGSLFLKMGNKMLPMCFIKDFLLPVVGEKIIATLSNGHGTVHLKLSNGATLIPMSDEEMNDSGVLFGYDTKTKSSFYVF